MVLRTAEGTLVGVFPANVDHETVWSHAGLTYGGLVLDQTTKLRDVLEGMKALLARFHSEGRKKLIYKTIPHIYHVLPAEEDRYALFRAGAALIRRDAWVVIDNAARGPVQDRRRRSAAKATRSGVTVRDTTDLKSFWTILRDNLQRKHGVDPVHTCDEMGHLAVRFPENIRLTAAFEGGTMVAGVLVFLTRSVCHVQYPAASERGMKIGALDIVHESLIEQYRPSRRFYDFGSSTEDAGRRVNAGLMDFKEGFGARCVVHDFYEVDIERALQNLSDV